MKSLIGLIFGVTIGVALSLAGTGDAYAKRLGGGSSFGSRPSYSEPYRRAPALAQPGMSQPGAAVRQPEYASAWQRNQAVRDALAQRGGLMRMLGGLAIGGLLGALLFGGAFEHINLLDLLIFGLIAFMLFKLLAARRRTADGQAVAAGYSGAMQRQGGPAGFDTDLLFGKSRPAPVGTGAAGLATRPANAPVLPADFDPAAFLTGAKAAYEMLQKAWDEGDLATLRSLSTDKVFAELQEQIRARGGAPNHTELLEIEAEILEVRDVGTDREVAVLFDVLLRESAEEAPVRVREVWHFTRSKFSRQPTWFLDGLQQVED